MGNRLTKHGLLLMLAEVLALAVLAVVASSHFGLADGLRITGAYLIAYLVPLCVLKRARGTSEAAHAVLFVLALLMVIVAWDCLVEWTKLDGYTLERPNLLSDARNYYKWALWRYDGSVESGRVVFPGFPLMMLGLWKVLGLNVIWPQAMNVMFTMTSVVLTGMTTRRLLTNRVLVQPRTLLIGGMLLMFLLCYYLMSGINILKEATIFLSVSMVGYALSSMVADDSERHRLWRDVTLFVLSCVLMAFVRTTYLYFLIPGVVLMGLPHWRRDWVLSLCFLALIVVSLLVGNQFAAYSLSQHAEIVGGGWDMQRAYELKQTYFEIVGYYFLYSPLHRFVLLPVTMTVQYFIPFLWNTQDVGSHLLNVVSRTNFGWYVLGGIALFYYFYLSWRRRERLGVWTWWPVIVFASMAFVTAGTTVRYVLPFQPFFVPVAIYVLCRLYEGRWRKPFIRWYAVYVVLVVVTLLVCLELQRSTFSTMLHTRPLMDYFRGLFC